jgi:hypothetical protein
VTKFLVIIFSLILFFRWNWIRANKRDEEDQKRTDEWLSINEGKVIFFFTSKADNQEAIFDKIVPFIKEDVELAYHVGPKVICTLEPFPTPYLLKNAYNSDRGFKLGTPCLLELTKAGFELKIDLSELKNALETDFDFAPIIKRINENT